MQVVQGSHFQELNLFILWMSIMTYQIFPSVKSRDLHTDCFFLRFAGGSVVIPTEFRGKIFDIPLPTVPGPFVGHTSFSSRVQLIARNFDTGTFSSFVLC